MCVIVGPEREWLRYNLNTITNEKGARRTTSLFFPSFYQGTLEIRKKYNWHLVTYLNSKLLVIYIGCRTLRMSECDKD